MPIVEVVDQLVGESHHELPFHSWFDLQAPELRVHVRREADLSGEGVRVDIHGVIVAIVRVVLSELSIFIHHQFLILHFDALFEFVAFFKALDDVADGFSLPLKLLLGVRLWSKNSQKVRKITKLDLPRL